jgi:hypothetical protein
MHFKILLSQGENLALFLFISIEKKVLRFGGKKEIFSQIRVNLPTDEIKAFFVKT